MDKLVEEQSDDILKDSGRKTQEKKMTQDEKKNSNHTSKSLNARKKSKITITIK